MLAWEMERLKAPSGSGIPNMIGTSRLKVEKEEAKFTRERDGGRGWQA